MLWMSIIQMKLDCIKNFSPKITVMVSHDEELLKKMGKIYHFSKGKISL